MRQRRRCFWSVLMCMLLLSLCFSVRSEAAVKLSKKKLKLAAGNACVLKLTGNEAGKKVTWKSSKPKVVKVVSSGSTQAVLKLKKKGTAVITAKVGKKKLTCRVTVKKKTGMPKKLTLLVGDKITLSVKKKARWSVSNGSLASVKAKKKGKKGTVKAFAPGTAVVTAEYGKKRSNCTITILTKDGGGPVSPPQPAPQPKPENLTITISSTGLFFDREGSSEVLQLKKGTETVTGVTWKSSNPKVATVSSVGRVHPVADGSAVITGTVGGKNYTCNVTVKLQKDEEQIEAAQTVVRKSVAFVKTGMTFTPSITGVPSDAAWVSKNTKVITVLTSSSTKKKYFKAVGEGKTTAEVTVGGKQYIYTLTVRQVSMKNTASLTAPKVTLNVTFTKTNSVYYPRLYWFDTKEEITGITWASADTKIAKTVKTTDGKWKVKPVANGKTKVTCKYRGGTFTLNVTVNIPTADPPAISSSSHTFTKAKATCTVYLKNYSGSVTWKSSNTKVATVTTGSDGVGKVTAAANGTANISATVSGKTYTMKVTVNIPEDEDVVKFYDKSCKIGTNTMFTYKAPYGWSVKVEDNNIADFAYTIKDSTGKYYVKVYTSSAPYKNKKAADYFYAAYGNLFPSLKYRFYTTPMSGYASTGYDTAGVFAGFARWLASKEGSTKTPKILQKTGKTLLTGDVLHTSTITQKSGKTTKEEQIFFAAVSNVIKMIYTKAEYPNLKDIDPRLEYNVDYGPLTVSNLVCMNAPSADFDNYAPILAQIHASIAYSDYFIKERANASEETIAQMRSEMEKADRASEQQVEHFLDYLRGTNISSTATTAVVSPK